MPFAPFELSPKPGNPPLEHPAWTVAETEATGYPHPKVQEVAFVGSLNAAEIVSELLLRGYEALPLVAKIEAFVARTDLRGLDSIAMTDRFLEAM